MSESNGEPALDPQAAYLARCEAICDLVDALPYPARAFVQARMDDVRRLDRLKAAHMEYALAFVEGVAGLVDALLTLPAWRPPRVADQTHRGSGR